MYTYVKGKGWVLTYFKVLEFDKGDGWWLICENRLPEDGEKCWVEHDFEYTAHNLGTLKSWTVERLSNQVGTMGRGNQKNCCTFRLEKR